MAAQAQTTSEAETSSTPGTRQGADPGKAERTSLRVIDCDVHHDIPSVKNDLGPYMAPEWRRYIQWGFTAVCQPYARFQGDRHDLQPEEGHGRASMSIAKLRDTHLDVWNIERALLLPGLLLGVSYLPQHELATALAQAHNDFDVDTWLATGDERLKGTISVAAQDPIAAAREIDRMAEHPEMVQVGLPVRSPGGVEWGDEKYYPIWEAAQRNDLPVAFHLLISTADVAPPTTSGWPRSYMEAAATYPIAAQSELVSLVSRGVFVKYPRLRAVFVENGFEWVPPLTWRLDAKWREMRAEVPWLTRPPGDYIRDHVRFTTQPVAMPDNPKHLVQLIDMMGSDEVVMFSSDWPHWDFDSPTRALPAGLSTDLKKKIMSENARAFYRF